MKVGSSNFFHDHISGPWGTDDSLILTQTSNNLSQCSSKHSQDLAGTYIKVLYDSKGKQKEINTDSGTRLTSSFLTLVLSVRAFSPYTLSCAVLGFVY